ncbi:MAG TPA: universal stress protein [Candidatus Eremiobacteraeota bacterium]|nr:MAG: Universal stress protein family protein [bacterium ADurb.Bin363]HPZ08327.1 universal stress protein [Candidatus Eremiobacteraeota bacterium]
MIKSILVPIGTSKCSFTALKTGVNLANLLKATLRLLYVEDTTKMVAVIVACRGVAGVSMGLPGIQTEKEELEEIREEIEKEKEVVQKYYNEVKEQIEGEHSLVVRTGKVTEEILKEIKTVDLVVMGKSLKKDVSGEIQSSLFGVIQKANKPMIAVHDVEDLGKNILIAYDGSLSANNSLKILGDLIPVLSPKINILTVKNDKDEASHLLNEGESYFLPYKVEINKLWKSGKVAENIIKKVEKKQISFVVMGGYGDNKFKEFLLGSTTEQILKALDIPVMVCNA